MSVECVKCGSHVHGCFPCKNCGCELPPILTGQDSKIAKLQEEIEHLRVQLAGCGVAAMCNTVESMEKQCVDREAYGWSQSYQDVLDAVRREIRYREALRRIADSITNDPQFAYKSVKQIAKEALEI